MKKSIVIFALLFTLPMFAENQQHQPRTPEEEWVYWQNHYDELNAEADTDASNRDIVAEVEGCKYCEGVQIDQQVWCMYLNDPELGEIKRCTTSSGNTCTGQYGCVDSWTEWVRKEEGEKYRTLNGTADVSTILQSAHGVSLSMQQWLEHGLSMPPGYNGALFTPYDYNVVGKEFGSNSYSTESRVYEFQYGTQYTATVKVWYCNLSGNACDEDTHVQP